MERFCFLVKKIIPSRLYFWVLPFYHFGLAWFAALFYGFPSRRLVVIGVTGTKGKTTVVELVHEILQETGVGVASLSSLRFRMAGQEVSNDKKMTMPGRFFIQKFLHGAVKNKCKYAVLEITSEGIKQFRHRFIKFDVAAMTNVAPEHVEAHGSFEKYLRAKLDLFWRLDQEAVAVINKDDSYAPRFSAATAAHKVFYGSRGIKLPGRNWEVRNLQFSETKTEFDLNDQTLISSLPGEFNFYNVLAAVTVGLSQHLSPEKIAAAVARVSKISGRMELMQKEPFTVMVDYAHTPASLKKIYSFLRENLRPRTPNQKLICVLGAAGGGRDKWKRPELGKIAVEFCDEIILTNEDPYDEDPSQILSEIESGIFDFQNSPPRRIPGLRPSEAKTFASDSIFKILDRQEAIREALKSAKPGDTVIITGKGAELWIMGPNNTRLCWDDREVVREELQKILLASP